MTVLKTLKQLKISCPASWEGESVDGKQTYISYRYGRLIATVGDKVVYNKLLGGNTDGYINTQQMLRYTEFKIEEKNG